MSLAECGSGSASTRPTRPRDRVRELTAEAITEFLGMLALRKAEHGHVHVVVAVGVAARARRQSLPLAGEVDRQVVVAQAAIRGQSDLVRPTSIHRRLTEFAFTIDQGRLRNARRPRSTLLAANGGRTRVHGPRAALDLCSRVRTKKGQTTFSSPAVHLALFGLFD